ncbi:hypothetical protein ACFE04_001270 [Oxalis oulophora]
MTKPKRTRATPTCSSSSSSSTIINSSSPPPAIIKADSTTTTKLKPKRPRKNNDNASSRITTTTSGARSSKYRGVTRHHHNGRWEARIGRVYGNKYLYLGTYKSENRTRGDLIDSQEEAAEAYDMAALEYRGPTAVTNFDINIYVDRLKMKGIDIMSPQNSISQFEQQLPPQQQAEAEVEVEQQQQQQPEQLPLIQKVEEQILQPQVPEYIDFTNNPTQPMVMMDDSTIDHGLDWSFCMDPTVGFTNELNVSDFSFQETSSSDDFQGLKFEDIDFDGNIDLMFESISSWPYNGSEGVYLESESRSSFELATNDQAINCNGTSNEGVGLGKAEDKEEGKDRKMCASSPATSSASTSVSCSYLV